MRVLCGRSYGAMRMLCSGCYAGAMRRAPCGCYAMGTEFMQVLATRQVLCGCYADATQMYPTGRLHIALMQPGTRCRIDSRGSRS